MELARSSDSVTARRATALLALFQMEQKRYDDASASLARAATLDPDVAPFLLLRLATVEEQRGNFPRATEILTQIAAAYPSSSASITARLRLPADHARANDIAATDASFKQVGSIAIDELSEEDFVALGDRLAAAGRPELADAIRLRLLTTYAEGRFTEKIYSQLTESAAAPIDAMTADASIDLASRLARANRYDQTLDLLDRLTKKFPRAVSTNAFLSVRDRALFHSRRYTDLLATTGSDKPRDPASQLLRARAAWRLNRNPEFLAGLEKIERDAPGSKEAIEAKILRSKYYVTDETNYDLSLQHLQSAIDAGSLGNDGENLWNLGWTYALAGRDTEALATFDRYIGRYPDGDYRSNSLFWAGKLLMRAAPQTTTSAATVPDAARARFEQLIAEYPYGYFSYRAREILGREPVASSSIANGNVFPDIDAALASVTDPRLATVRELVAIGLQRDAIREMKTLAATLPDNPGIAFALADIYIQGGEPFKANNILQRQFRQFVRHGGTNVPQRFWEILYPLNHWETIRTEAARRNIDPYLVTSIIRQESGFEPSTVSNAGAVGLMQIMPAEAAAIAAKAGIDLADRAALFDADKNIAVGAAEFRQKLDLMNQNTTLAIAAYNAGEEAVRRWVAKTPVDDLDRFVESIPYAETRLYVKTVTRNRFEYRRIYESSRKPAEMPVQTVPPTSSQPPLPAATPQPVPQP